MAEFIIDTVASVETVGSIVSVATSGSNISGCVRGLQKDQDLMFCGENVLDICGTPFHWGVILDGHGSSKFINIMKTFDWRENMSVEHPWERLQAYLETIKGSYGSNSGSTLLMMRSFSDRVETWAIGDSTVIIYKNGVKVYENTPHNLSNPVEVQRLNSLPTGSWEFTNAPQPFPKIRNPTTLQAKTGGYFYFPPYDPGVPGFSLFSRYNSKTVLAMSQAIGHNNTLGNDVEAHVEYFEESDKVRCILGSDGIFDMILLPEPVLALVPPPTEEELDAVECDKMDLLTMSAEQLCDKIEARWKQDWEYRYNMSSFDLRMISNFIGGLDDISAVVWDKK